MKLEFKFNLVLSIVLLCATSLPAVAGKGGGSSTTGGGDWIVHVTELLPDSIEIRATYDVRREFSRTGGYYGRYGTMKIGTRRCYGVLSCDAYAYYMEETRRYEKVELSNPKNKRGGVRYDLTAYGDLSRGDKTSRKVFIAPDYKGDWNSLIFADLDVCDPARRECKGDKHKLYWTLRGVHLNSFSLEGNWNPMYAFRVLWNGKSIDLQELYGRLAQVASTLSRQVDFDHPETVGQVEIFSKILDGLVLNHPLFYNKRYGQILRKALDERLKLLVTQEGEYLWQMLKAVVSADGSCDVEGNRRFLSELQKWGQSGSCARHASITKAVEIALPKAATECMVVRESLAAAVFTEVFPVCSLHLTPDAAMDVRVILQPESAERGSD